MSAQDLLDVLTSAADQVGADQPLVLELADAFENLGRGTLVLATAFGDGALGETPLTAQVIKALGDALVNDPGSSVPDTVLSRAMVHRIAIALNETMRGERTGTRRAAASSDDKEGDAGTAAYKDYADLQNVVVPLSRQCQFVGPARLSVNKHGYIQTLPGLANLKLRGCGNTGKRAVGEGISLAIDDDVPQRTTTIQQCYGLTKTAVRGVAAVLSVPCAPGDFGGGEEGWIPAPGRAGQVRVCLSAASAEHLIDTFIGSALQDPPAYGRMFNSVMSKFIDNGPQRLIHADKFIAKVTSDSPQLFHTDPSPGEGTDPNAVRAAKAAAVVGDAAPATARDAKAVCKAWCDNGSCRDYDNDGCGYSHPPSLRNAGRNNGASKRSRNGGGGNSSGGGNSNGGGGNWGSWDQWSGWYPPSSSGKGGGKGGKGGRKGGKGGGKGGGSNHDQWWW